LNRCDFPGLPGGRIRRSGRYGTHVCGSVPGDGVAEDGTVIRGTAARLVMQSVLDPQGGLGGLPVDLHDLFLPPYQDDGARVHTNSWGGNLDKGCGSSVAEVIKVAAQVSAQPVSADVCLRRPGDPPILVSDSSKAREQLGVVPRQHANV
jgi:hypothetical protein